MNQQVPPGPATDPVPTVGACDTAWCGFYACRHVELCGEDVDGCAIDHPFSEDYGPDDHCPAFECSPAAMFARAGRYIERLELVRQAARRLAGAATDALSSEDREEEVRDAIEEFRRTDRKA